MPREFCSHCDQDRRFTMQHYVLDKNKKSVIIEERVCQRHWLEWKAKKEAEGGKTFDFDKIPKKEAKP